MTLVIGLGGALGAVARYLMGIAVAGPLSTFVVNVVGCLLIGVLMTLILEVWVGHRLLRPFLGIGVLGGFTTFSTYAVEGITLFQKGMIGVGYVLGTVVTALAAAWAGAHLTGLLIRRNRRSS